MQKDGLIESYKVPSREGRSASITGPSRRAKSS
ncbi:hypothetical protein [Rubrobacter marinus]